MKITKNRTETVGVVQMSEAVPEPLCNLKAKKQIWKPVCEKGNVYVSQWERREERLGGVGEEIRMQPKYIA